MLLLRVALAAMLPALASAGGAAQGPPSSDSPPTLQDIKGRLAAYEKRVAQTGRQEPASLAEIATLGLTRALKSATFEVWSEACVSPYAAATAGCDDRLKSTFRQAKAPLATRVAAGAALIGRGDRDAASALFDLVKERPVSDLAQVAALLTRLPPDRATTLLARVVKSDDPAHQAAACRALGTIDSGEVRQVLREAVAQIPPGTDPWFSCTIARARLNETDTTWKMPGISSYLAGQRLLDAADAMLAVGDQRGLDTARKVTRESAGVIQIEAAERLAPSDVEYARKIADARRADKDPFVRARALVLERQLNRTPSPEVRTALIDPHDLVQLRAAEAMLDWAARESKR